MDFATGHVDTITQAQVLEPDWGYDSGLILYRGGNPYGLWVQIYAPDEGFDPVFFTADGFDDGAVWRGENSVLAQTSSGPYGDGLVILAYPNGYASYVACQESNQTSCSGEDPTPSPDYLWIAFYDGALEKVAQNGGTSVCLTTVAQGGAHPSWSPDGQWIAFVSYQQSAEETHSQIWVTDARGSSFGLVQLTDGSYLDDDPAWSPDSHEIYFTSNRSGSDEIWKVPFDPEIVPVAKLTWGKLKARYGPEGRVKSGEVRPVSQLLGKRP